MGNLTQAEAQELADFAAFEHGRRTEASRSSRMSTRRARTALREACLALGEEAPLWIPIDTDTHVVVKTVQSQRALDSKSLTEAIREITDEDVASAVATAPPTLVARTDEELRIRAWWEQVVARAHRRSTVPTRTVTIVASRCPREYGTPGVCAPSEKIISLVTDLHQATASADGERHSNAPKTNHKALVAALERAYQSGGPTVCVNTTDGCQHMYGVAVSQHVTRKTPTPAHLRKGSTVQHVMPHLRTLYNERRTPGACSQAANALLHAARGVGERREQRVKLYKSKEKKIE